MESQASSLTEYLSERVRKTIRAYKEDPERIIEDARSETQLLSGGYGQRQLYELIQNGADALTTRGCSGRVAVILTEDKLYCANEGDAFTEGGVRALLMAHMSDKQGDEIGRFGLGFKSVLGLCEHPEVFSDSIDFRFNPPALAEQLRALVEPEDPLPCLRTAEVLNFEGEASTDLVLADLKSWATTVIRLHLKMGVRDRLVDEIQNFPSEFLVFSPHVSRLEFRVSGEESFERQLQVKKRGETVIVREGRKRTAWKVFAERIRLDELSKEAVADMDYDLKRRDSIPLMWAAPLGGISRTRSKFWAFFPTQDETTLKGILNAPWKTNSDRENLIEGPFNEALLKRAADLVTRSLQQLNTPEDPARFLDVLPAQEDTGSLDRVLAQAVFEKLRQVECMPTVRGAFQRPSEVCLRPKAAFFEQLEDWFGQYGQLEFEIWAHRKVEAGDRRSRAKRLGCVEEDLQGWMASFLEPESLEASIAALHLADAILSSDTATSLDKRGICHSRIVFTAAETLVVPSPNSVSFAEAGDKDPDPNRRVHPELSKDPVLREILTKHFKIQGADAEFAFKSFLASRSPYGNAYWEEFWSLTRALDAKVAQKILKAEKPHLRIYVRALDGLFHDVQQVLEPGWIIKEVDDDSTRSVTVDIAYHDKDNELLAIFGVREDPYAWEPQTGHLWEKYKQEAVIFYQTECAKRNLSKPNASLIVVEKPSGMGMLDVLPKLSGSNAARFTRRLADLMDTEEFDDWGDPVPPDYFVQLKHRTRNYPEIPFDALYSWVIKRYGWVETSVGPVRVKNAVDDSFEEWSDFLPVFTPPEYDEVRWIKVQSSIETFGDDQWRSSLGQAQRYEGDIQVLTGFYALMARNWNRNPKELRCRVHTEWSLASRYKVHVTCSPEEARMLEHGGKPYLYASTAGDVGTLIEKWDLKPAESGKVGFIPADDLVLALSKFPGLSEYASDFIENVRLQPCRELWMEIRSSENGTERIDTQTAFAESTYYFMGSPADDVLLQALCAALDLDLPEERFQQIVHESESASIESRREAIRQVDDIESKLVHAIGVDQLRARIPSRHLSWLASVKDSPSEHEIARLAHTIHGVEVLKAYKDALAFNGLQPPSQWAGGAKAIAFVEDLGFPDEYAGFAGQGREPWDDRQGPTTLNPLHEFQKPVRDKVVKLLSNPEPQRAILTLPTGAGKTRVTVQSLIEWISETEGPRTVLWIAQSDELCEQAVQCWLEAWHAMGPDDQWMRVNRLWGSTNNRVRAPEEGSSIVVATYQSLSNRLEDEKFSWVFEPDATVIDEAHGSTAPSYTAILKRLGLYRDKSERPLLGLTATPFRGGESGDETYRLANRFEYNRIATDFEDSAALYAHLQQEQILAYADHEVLPGESISLSPEELEELEKYKVLPDSAQRRLSEIETRNERILDHILSQPEDWPILVFSVTKDHAEDLAVRLDMSGISSRAIDGDTPDGRRQRDIEAFKRGEIRVLTNYGVLTTGFDAPKIRAVYVTRPVYSVGLYQQMVGRGLRGPRNGGKERCLIVNVEDNVEQYGQKLAFERFDHLWVTK